MYNDTKLHEGDGFLAAGSQSEFIYRMIFVNKRCSFHSIQNQLNIDQNEHSLNKSIPQIADVYR